MVFYVNLLLPRGLSCARITIIIIASTLILKMQWPVVDNSSTNNEFPTVVHHPSRDSTAMAPLHWACTEGDTLAVVGALLHAACNAASRSGGLELRDATGCTP
jgi:ankyrin repeat protein